MLITTRNYPAVAGMKAAGVWHVDANDPCNTGGWYAFTNTHTLKSCNVTDSWTYEIPTQS